MIEHPGRFRRMTDGALAQCAGIALELDKLDRIVRFPARGNSVRAIMAGLAVHPARGTARPLLFGIDAHRGASSRMHPPHE